MIVVLGSVLVRESHLQEALRLSHEHVARSRTEPGCISHGAHQDTENPHRLVFVEEWADHDSLARHFKVPASGQFVRSLGALAAQAPTMTIYEAKQLSR
jgi:quinol monooxygenase YgiN